MNVSTDYCWRTAEWETYLIVFLPSRPGSVEILGIDESKNGALSMYVLEIMPVIRDAIFGAATAVLLFANARTVEYVQFIIVYTCLSTTILCCSTTIKLYRDRSFIGQH